MPTHLEPIPVSLGAGNTGKTLFGARVNPDFSFAQKDIGGFHEVKNGFYMWSPSLDDAWSGFLVVYETALGSASTFAGSTVWAIAAISAAAAGQFDPDVSEVEPGVTWSDAMSMLMAGLINKMDVDKAARTGTGYLRDGVTPKLLVTWGMIAGNRVSSEEL